MYFKVKQFNSKTLRLCNAKCMSRFSTVFQYFQYLCNIFQYFQSIFCTFFVLSEYWENEGQKRTRFSILPAPVPTYFWVSIVFSHWNAYNQDPKKPWTHFSSFRIIIRKILGTLLCSSLLELCVCVCVCKIYSRSIKVIECPPHRNILPTKFC